MKELTVALGERSYPIYIGTGIVRNVGALLEQAGLSLASGLIVTDSNVGPLYADEANAALGWSQAPCVLPAGEEAKRLAQVEYMCGRFLEAGLDRGSLIVALGGGVVGDMAGFAAACFMRGVRCVQIPTTIVAQVDSSVGGKTGVNHALGKNTIGAFHQPSAVVMDLSLLQTLPDRELKAGLAEAIKHGVIADAGLFAYLEAEAPRVLAKNFEALEVPILRSCEIKAAIVAADEKEHGQRANLNYGHTFGHAIETVSGYGMFLHGEALSLGMHAAGVLAQELGLVDDAFVNRQRACLAMYGLPVLWPEIPIEETLLAMRRDKKSRAGKLKFIVADGMGSVVQRTDVTEAQARKALEALEAEHM